MSGALLGLDAAGLRAPDGTVTPVEASWRLPLAGGSVAGVDVRFVPPGPLEPRWLATLRECRRVVAPGGIVEVDGASVPDDRRRAGLGYDAVDAVGARARLVTRHPVALGPDPLVSVLVKGYRSAFLDEAIASARRQTWSNLEVVVSHDGGDEEVRLVTERHAAADPRVRYVGRAGRPGGVPATGHVIAHARGELLKMLDDDDVLEPDCVRRLASCLQAEPQATLAISRYLPIDAAGRSHPVLCLRLPTDGVVDGASTAADVVRGRANWLGTPSMSMFRRSDLPASDPTRLGDTVLTAAGDVGIWLNLLGRGDAVVLNEPLARYRLHDGQRTREAAYAAADVDAWDRIAAEAPGLGILADEPAELVWTPMLARPWWPDELRRAVLAAERAPDPVTALRLLAAALRHWPEEPTLAYLTAGVLVQIGETDQAADLLEPVVTSTPWFVPAVRVLAHLRAESGDLLGASALVHQALGSLPYDPASLRTVRTLAASLV